MAGSPLLGAFPPLLVAQIGPHWLSVTCRAIQGRPCVVVALGVLLIPDTGSFLAPSAGILHWELSSRSPG